MLGLEPAACEPNSSERERVDSPGTSAGCNQEIQQNDVNVSDLFTDSLASWQPSSLGGSATVQLMTAVVV